MKLSFKLNNLSFDCTCSPSELREFIGVESTTLEENFDKTVKRLILENLGIVVDDSIRFEKGKFKDLEDTTHAPKGDRIYSLKTEEENKEVFGQNQFTPIPAFKVWWKGDKLALTLSMKKTSIFNVFGKTPVLTLVDDNTISLVPSMGKPGYRYAKNQLSVPTCGTLIDEESPFFEYFFTRMSGDSLQITAIKNGGVWRVSE